MCSSVLVDWSAGRLICETLGRDMYFDGNLAMHRDTIVYYVVRTQLIAGVIRDDI